jgi:hypothetical protein
MISEQLLRRYVVGVLDPAEADLVADWVDADPELARQAMLIGRDLDHPSPWSLPLAGMPGLGPWGSMLQGETRAPMVMGEQGHSEVPTAKMGQSLVMEVPIDVPADLHLLCMRRVEGAPWEIVLPRRVEEWLPVSRFPKGKESYQVTIVLGPPPGLQEWALWLVDPELPVHWERMDESRWDAVFTAPVAGRASCASRLIEVRAR